MSKRIRNIYYLCPDNNVPSGGVHKIYTHVEILNSLGYTAYVLHTQFGFRSDWFKNNAPIAYPTNYSNTIYDLIKKNWTKGIAFETIEKSRLPPTTREDILVISESIAHAFQNNEIDFPFVIFNQNAYCSFKNTSGF